MKMRRLKKVLSITLASVMLVASIPSGALADAEKQTEQTETADQGSNDQGGVDQGSVDQGNSDQGSDQGSVDQGNSDQGSVDQGNSDQGSVDQGNSDQGSVDQGNSDQGSVDQGSSDQGSVDQGNSDQGSVDQGNSDQGNSDQGSEDQGNSDQGSVDQGNSDQGNSDQGSEDQGNSDQGSEDQGDKEDETSTQEVTVSWSIENNAKLVWNGKNQRPTAQAGNIVLDYNITRNNVETQEVKEPGEYKIIAVARDTLENIKLIDAERTFSIIEATVSLEWGNLEATYTGEKIQLPQAWFISADGSGTKLYADVSCQEEDIINAEEYHMSATLSLEQAVYYKVIDGSDKKIFRVNPCPVDIELADKTVTYNKAPYVIGEPTYDKTVYSDSITINYTKDGINVEQPTDVGTYEAEVVLDNANYCISEGSKSTGNLTILPYPVDIELTDKTVTYNKAPYVIGEPTYDKTVYSDSVTINYTKDGIKVEQPTDVGTYEAEVVLDNANYCISEGSKSTGNLTILPYPVDIKLTDKTVTYNKAPHFLEEPMYDKTVYSDSVTINYTKDGIKVEQPTDAGTYKAEVVLDNTNYCISISEESSSTGTLTILPCEVSFECKNAETYYDQKEHTLLCESLTELYEGDFKINYVNSVREPVVKPKNADVYTATVQQLDDPNFYISEEALKKEATLTINKLPVVVQADPKSNSASKIYGESDPELEYEVVSVHEELMSREEVKKELGEGVLDRDQGEEVGSYKYKVSEKEHENYTVKYNEDQENVVFTINKLQITIKAIAAKKVYGDEDPELKYKVVIPQDAKKEESDIREALGNTVLKREDGEDVGSYAIELAVDPQNYGIAYVGADFKINPLPVTVTAVRGQDKVYGASNPRYDFNVEFDEGITQKSTEDVKKELKGVLSREKGEDVGAYVYKLSEKTYDNFDIDYQDQEEVVFTINPLPITVTAKADQSKIYGAEDPKHIAYDVIFDEGVTQKNEEDVKSELNDKFDYDILKREEGEDAGTYGYALIQNGKSYGNFNVTYQEKEGVEFIINQLPVTVNPNEGQEKIFGQADSMPYDFSISYDENLTKLTEDMILEELGASVLQRRAGEAVGKYRYEIIPEFTRTVFKNFELTIPENAPKFAIRPIVIRKVDSINSRQDSFRVTTNLDNNNLKRKKGVTTKFKVEAIKLPESTDGILFSDDINTFITNASAGIAFNGTSDTIKINTVTYQKQRKDNGELLAWDGYLPAGTVIEVSIVDESGKKVSRNSIQVTVAQVNVEIGWENYQTSESTGNYVVANNGTVNPLSVTSSRTDEWAEVLYSKNGGGTAEASYDKLNMTFSPDVNNSELKHVIQSAAVNVVDTLNLKCTEKTLQFYVDDIAFTIPTSSIQFENRGDEIRVQLPEVGIITNVTIPGGTVTTSGEVSQEFVLPVSWSGRELIPTGTGISVEYTDQAGHQGNGTAAAVRSSVATPITFRIRPELNANGYLNGRSSTMIVSGTACSCEPIQVTVAGMSQTTNATEKEVWSDTNGSWEVLVDMNSLPENQEFTISAEYMDVNGTGYSITAKFDSFCASPVVFSPIYEAMTHISGMVEPGTAVALVINGETQNYYEIQADRFGHFMKDDVPMMFGGEDSFDIYVTDIAGNVSIRHYEIEEPEDPFEVSSVVNPLGKFFYSADEENSVAYAATPISANDFDEEKDSIEIPLLMGMSYEVGVLTIKKTENGFTVSSEIQVDKAIVPEDYRIENEKLYVYTGRPSIEDIKNCTGQEYQYGTEILLGEGETVWIVDNKDMTILADDIMELELFDYENSQMYVTYQEK